MEKNDPPLTVRAHSAAEGGSSRCRIARQDAGPAANVASRLSHGPSLLRVFVLLLPVLLSASQIDLQVLTQRVIADYPSEIAAIPAHGNDERLLASVALAPKAPLACN